MNHHENEHRSETEGAKDRRSRGSIVGMLLLVLASLAGMALVLAKVLGGGCPPCPLC